MSHLQMKQAKNKKGTWKNRIVGHGEKTAGEFNFNPLNWRQHPDSQRAALREVLDKIGWITGVIENVTTGNLIDGHGRIKEALERDPSTIIPFTKVKLTEAEEKQMLLLFDPIGDMATPDLDALRGLLEMVGIDSEALLEVLSRIDDLELPDVADLDPNLNDPNFNYQSQFGVIVQCDDEKHQKKVFNALNELGYKVKVVVV
jgi:hypothetical protein